MSHDENHSRFAELDERIRARASRWKRRPTSWSGWDNSGDEKSAR